MRRGEGLKILFSALSLYILRYIQQYKNNLIFKISEVKYMGKSPYFSKNERKLWSSGYI
jgi:hypothetical protein